MRPSGIDVVGDLSWGAHFCLFYRSEQELLKIQIPYFKAGLLNGEYCVWVTSDSLPPASAYKALAGVLPDLDHRISQGQIEILGCTDGFLKSGRIQAEPMLQAWADRLGCALDAGYPGMRLSGNICRLKPAEWRDFMDYEEALDKVISRYRMIALCTHNAACYGVNEILDMMSHHSFALVSRNGRWKTVRNGIVRRLTEEPHERRLQERTAELFQAQKMEAVGRLAGGIAHDFNNMMQVVTGYAQRTLLELSSDDPLRENVERMKEAGESAAELTRQLLAFSKKQNLRLITLNLNDIIVKMEALLRRTLGDEVVLVTRLQAGLHSIKGDPVRLQQVLVNLALNSRDAMDKGGTLTIETADVSLGEAHPYGDDAVPAGPYVMLAVSDTGCGMDKETQARAFDPFYTTKPQGKGTGLGLSMVYGTVQQSGGIIRIYSTPGEGTTFKIYFPRTAEPAPVPPSSFQASAAQGGGETLLLVEDNDKVREFTFRELTDLGYRVLAARDEAEALAAVSAYDGPIHLLITDVMLPGRSGRGVSEVLSAKHPEIKTLYISGYAEEHIVERGILLPMTDFLPKPFTMLQLASKIRQLLGPSLPDGRRLERLQRRVLVVDDVPGVAETVAYILAKEGYEVRAAMDGISTLDLARTFEPDAVLIDIELPDINGYDLAGRIRQLGLKRMPYLIITSGHSLRQHGESEGFDLVDEYLEKPLDFKKLKQVLAAGLNAADVSRPASA